jgi:sirohydrochlorin ferrochelatase
MWVMPLVYPPEEEPSPSPRMSTVHAVARILKESAEADEDPLSLAEIGRRLPAKRVRHETVRACVNELKLLGFASEGSKGVLWTLASPAVLDAKHEEL